jgi:hypothetical protein
VPTPAIRIEPNVEADVRRVVERQDRPAAVAQDLRFRVELRIRLELDVQALEPVGRVPGCSSTAQHGQCIRHRLHTEQRPKYGSEAQGGPKGENAKRPRPSRAGPLLSAMWILSYAISMS